MSERSATSAPAPMPASGEFAGKLHHLPIRVYYEDTDFSGIVYHASYLKFLERGRTEYLRASGKCHAELLAGDPPLAFAVRHMDLTFVAPSRIDDALDVQTRFTAARGARLLVFQQVFLGGQLLIEATVEMAVIDLQGRPKRLPAWLADMVKPWLLEKPT